MLDMIMRSLGLDPQKVQSMMDEASQEYRRQMTAVFERFEALQKGQDDILKNQQHIITLLTEKEINHGTGANQRQFAELIGNAEIVQPGAGTIEPFEPGNGKLHSDE